MLVTRSAAALAAGAALALGAAADAHAAVPTGTYDCTYWESKRTFGIIDVVSGSTYRWNREKRGRYAAAGKSITFKTGPMADVFAHAQLRRGSGTVWINLYDGDAGFGHTATDVQCVRRGR